MLRIVAEIAIRQIEMVAPAGRRHLPAQNDHRRRQYHQFAVHFAIYESDTDADKVAATLDPVPLG